jgi:hypothetical protein
MIKRTLIAGVAALAVLHASAATAVERDLRVAPARVEALPETMLGGWCPSAIEGIYARSDKAKGDPNWVTVRRKDWDWVESGCTAKRIERITASSYLVLSRCEGEGMPPFSNSGMFELLDDDLSITQFEQTVREPKLSYLIAKYTALIHVCRGLTEDQIVGNRIPAACRGGTDDLHRQIQARGYCFGRENQSHAEMRWHRCESDSLRR